MAMRVIVLIIVEVDVSQILVVLLQPLPGASGNLIFFRFVKFRARKGRADWTFITSGTISASTTTAATATTATARFIRLLGTFTSWPSRTLGKFCCHIIQFDVLDIGQDIVAV
jgi:hypothetical protein